MFLTVLGFMLMLVPIVLTFLWVTGALTFYFFRERKNATLIAPATLPSYPKVTVIIPCHNEAKTIHATINSLDKVIYPNLEVIAVNDCSRDATGLIIDNLAEQRTWMKTIHLNKNRGKAAALNVAMLGCSGDVIICIDADSELHPHAVTWLVSHLISNPKLGAVTGNPRVKNRNNLIGRLQVGEFSATIGMIKRYQQMIGKLFTVSGVIVAYRKEAVIDVGFWDTESVTEDIAMSWRLQTSGWELGYEPRAVCDVLMPGTLKGLWRQRLRWAQGGFEVMSKHWKFAFRPGNWQLKVLYFEYIFSVIWTFICVASLIFGFSKLSMGITTQFIWLHSLMWGVFISGILGFIQFLPGFSIHSRYERLSLSVFFWAVWYPLIYWMLNSAVLFVAIPKALFAKPKQYGTWVSPDRGGIVS